MAQVTVTVGFDQTKGTVKFSLDLQGETQLEHELLVATIGSGRSVSISPAHAGDELFAEFTIEDPSIWPKAIRQLENRTRVANGRPTIEEEEAQTAMRQAADADAEQKQKDAAAAFAKKIADDQAAADKRLTDAVAAGIAQGLKKA